MAVYQQHEDAAAKFAVVPLSISCLVAMNAVGCSPSDSSGAASVGRGGNSSITSDAQGGATATRGGAHSSSDHEASIPSGAAAGGKSSTGGMPSTGTATAQGGASSGTSTGGSSASLSESSSTISSTAACDDPSLTWKTANKTNYTSYPEPGSEECIEYSGCEYQGQFAACDRTKTESWVAARNIVAAFPSFTDLRLHDLCLRKGQKTIVVTVLDTCGDSDCEGCCTKNQGTADQLIDLESYTNTRWGVPDGEIEWADLGPTKGTGCDE